MTARRAQLTRLPPLLLLGLILAGLAAGIVRAAPQAAAPRAAAPDQGTIVISEFRTRGIGGEYDEFVELFNPSGQSIDIGGWIIRRTSACGAVVVDLATISAPRWLAPGQHFLVASGAASSLSADQVWSSTSERAIPDDGGIALFDPDFAAPVDAVGLCLTALYLEGEPLDPLTTNFNRGYERLPGGSAGNCTDSDDNALDFQYLATSDPQRSTSALTTACIPPTPTPTFTSSSTADTSDAILISEFRTRGLNGEDDELVELFNPGANTVQIGGWALWRSSGCSTVTSPVFIIPGGTQLAPGRHFLAASENASLLITPDLVYASELPDNGGMALLDDQMRIIDQVGMCVDTLYVEGDPLPPLDPDASEEQGYEREPGGIGGSCSDSGDNLADFSLISPSLPQNLGSPPVVCSGIATSTTTRTPTITYTRTPTPTVRTSTSTRTLTRTATRTRTPSAFPTSLPGNVVINEYLPRPVSDWNGDGEANSRDEYIELINMGATSIDIRNWKLDDLADGGSDPYTLPSLTLAPYEIVRFYASETGISLSDGGDSVRLLKPDGRTADSHFYSVVLASDRTWCRLPDGTGAWAFTCRPTPGRPNALPQADEPGREEQPVVTADCRLPDTIPGPFWLAECDSPGGDIWFRFSEGRLWLADHWKWDVFVE